MCVNAKYILERNPFITELNSKLVQGLPPISDRHRPFLTGVPNRQIEYLEYSVIGWKEQAVFCHFP